MKYILGIDQSTQGTKAILMDESGRIIGRADRSHEQIIDENGWVSHDLEEIYSNTLRSVRDVVEKTGISKDEICSVGISNQRETTAIWTKEGKALNRAVVWQCSRAKDIAKRLENKAEMIKSKTGLTLSPYFPAAKMAWLLENTDGICNEKENVCLGTIDSWLIYRLTEGKEFKTDYSNASRTQLFNLETLAWDPQLCEWFGIPMESLAQVCDSNSDFGMTDLDGYLNAKIPIQGVMGDSHAALYGQGCHFPGMIKTTYGTGSSIMMNVGDQYIQSSHGLVTSLAWGIDGKVSYVLEGNINYTGAVISWLKDDVGLIASPAETDELARLANQADEAVLIPAFSGLSAPYWKDDAKAMLYGMSRTTGKKEIVKAALESIAFQIQAVLDAMKQDSAMMLKELRVDGGPTRNRYLMQVQSNLSDLRVAVSEVEELSAAGVSYLAGIKAGLYKAERLFLNNRRGYFEPEMTQEERERKLQIWNEAIAFLIK